MRWRGKVIAGGDTLYVMHEGAWVPWVIDNWSPGTGDIYGRRAGGSLEKIPADARFNQPPPPVPAPPPMTRAERKAARKAHLEARDECVRQIRERDRAAGIVTISSGSYTNYRLFDEARGRRRY